MQRGARSLFLKQAVRHDPCINVAATSPFYSHIHREPLTRLEVLQHKPILHHSMHLPSSQKQAFLLNQRLFGQPYSSERDNSSAPPNTHISANCFYVRFRDGQINRRLDLMDLAWHQRGIVYWHRNHTFGLSNADHRISFDLQYFEHHNDYN